MPPAIDFYVWVPSPTPEMYRRFLDGYVDLERSEGDALDGFVRTYVLGSATRADAAMLAELGRTGRAGPFTLYLNGRGFHLAMITVTQEGAAVLGLSLDDPGESPDVHAAARTALTRLRREFGAPAELLGVELPPPQTRAEWLAESLALHREGEPP